MELMELKAELDALISRDIKLKRDVTAVAKLRWIQTSYAFDTADAQGVKLIDLKDVQRVIKEEYVENLTISDHLTIKNYADMVRFVYNVLPLKDKADVALIEKLNVILCRNGMLEEQPVDYRKTSPVIKEFALVPTYYQSVQESLSEMIRHYYVTYVEEDPVFRACYLHNELIKIYPFAENNEATARALLNFELVAAGFLPLSFTMAKADYCSCSAQYINGRGPEAFLNIVVSELKKQYREILNMMTEAF